MKYDFGLIGLGVMGQNLALNIERNGFSVATFDLNLDKQKDASLKFAKKKYLLQIH